MSENTSQKETEKNLDSILTAISEVSEKLGENWHVPPKNENDSSPFRNIKIPEHMVLPSLESTLYASCAKKEIKKMDQPTEHSTVKASGLRKAFYTAAFTVILGFCAGVKIGLELYFPQGNYEVSFQVLKNVLKTF